MAEMRKEALFVIYASEDGRKDWKPVPPAEIPAWVLDSETLGQMVNGNVAYKVDKDGEASLHYRADVSLNVWERERLMKAMKARAEREARTLLELPAGKQVVIETSELKH